jgi:hypothetical protein
MSRHAFRSATGGHTLLPAFSTGGPTTDVLYAGVLPAKVILRWTFGRDTVVRCFGSTRSKWIGGLRDGTCAMIVDMEDMAGRPTSHVLCGE